MSNEDKTHIVLIDCTCGWSPIQEQQITAREDGNDQSSNDKTLDEWRIEFKNEYPHTSQNPLVMCVLTVHFARLLP